MIAHNERYFWQNKNTRSIVSVSFSTNNNNVTRLLTVKAECAATVELFKLL